MDKNTTANKAKTRTPFEEWWYNEGSGIIPKPGQDHSEHVEEVCRIAWENGAFKEREAQQQRMDTMPNLEGGPIA